MPIPKLSTRIIPQEIISAPRNSWGVARTYSPAARLGKYDLLLLNHITSHSVPVPQPVQLMTQAEDRRFDGTSIADFAKFMKVPEGDLNLALKLSATDWDKQRATPKPPSYGSCVHQAEYALQSLLRGRPRAAMNIYTEDDRTNHMAALVAMSTGLYVAEHEAVIELKLHAKGADFINLRGHLFLIPLRKYLELFRTQWIQAPDQTLHVTLTNSKDEILLETEVASAAQLRV